MKQLGLLIVLVLSTLQLVAAETTLPNTKPLVLSRPVDEVMVDGINRFCLKLLGESPQQRSLKWQRDYSSPKAYQDSIEANRQRFRANIGVVDSRLTLKGDVGFELLGTLDFSSRVATSDVVDVHVVRWPVLSGVSAEGLLLVPKNVRAYVVALPEAYWTPEMFCGVAGDIPQSAQWPRRLASAGCMVAIPMLISRSDEFSGHPKVGYTNLTHREFIYRRAFTVGRHIIGYEVQKILAAVDLFERIMSGKKQHAKIGVVGVGDGALLALYAGAIDRRIDSVASCGYFQQREGVWKEPVDRNVWRLLSEFGDAELAGLIAPRPLVIEACRGREVTGPPPVRDARRQAAAPGVIATNRLEKVQAEFERVQEIYRRLNKSQNIQLVVSGQRGDGQSGSLAAIKAFATSLDADTKPLNESQFPWTIKARLRNASHREKRQFDELHQHVHNILRVSPQTRDRLWKANLSSLDEWKKDRKRLQAWVHDELIGRLPNKRIAPNPRSRQVIDNKHYTGYEVVLDVVEDVIAAGILLIPKDIDSDEKRPVVVCQHGLEGLAMDTISSDPNAYRSYKSFADKLCRRGFIVYAPQNPYRGRDRFRSIQRKANPLGLSLFSFIIAQHEQTLEWLAQLPQVDSQRIAFYGLSYGGKTAMRVPPFIDRYCLSICSGDFTNWVRVITTNEYRYGYIFTSEYEIPEWNMAHVASYAELAMLMSPRPFMVEQGHRDGGTPTEWVASEFGKVRRHYDFLKIGDRAEIEFFDGPHTINGKASFEFLHRHLRWP